VIFYADKASLAEPAETRGCNKFHLNTRLHIW
jgi:hypothetical protein